MQSASSLGSWVCTFWGMWGSSGAGNPFGEKGKIPKNYPSLWLFDLLGQWWGNSFGLRHVELRMIRFVFSSLHQICFDESSPECLQQSRSFVGSSSLLRVALNLAAIVGSSNLSFWPSKLTLNSNQTSIKTLWRCTCWIFFLWTQLCDTKWNRKQNNNIELTYQVQWQISSSNPHFEHHCHFLTEMFG